MYKGVSDKLHAELWEIIKDFGPAINPDLNWDATERIEQEAIINNVGFDVLVNDRLGIATVSLTTADGFMFVIDIDVNGP